MIPSSARLDAVADTEIVSRRERQEPAWWDFLGYRRTLVSDRTWFGLAFIAAGFSSLGSFHGWLELATGVAGCVGLVIVYAGIRRGFHRIDPETGVERPGPPW